MTPEERAFSIMAHVIERGGRDTGTIEQAIREAVAEEREECALLHDSISPTCDHEKPGTGAGAMRAIIQYRNAIRARGQA